MDLIDYCASLRRLTLLLLAAPVYAQTDSIRFDHFTINDGLSQSSVNTLLEDNRGFIWIGTQDGLNRFDGYQFVVYRHESNDEATLASNNVSTLYESQDGTLWVGTTGGTLHAYDRRRETFQRYSLLTQPGTSGSGTRTFDDVRQILETRDGRFWVGSRSGGLWNFEREEGAFRPVQGVRNIKVNSIVEGPDGALWIGTDERGLLWYWPDTGITESSLQPHAPIYKILRSSDGDMLVSGDEGIVYRYSADRQLLDQFTTRLQNDTSSYQVRSLLEDQRGRIWVGSIGGGLQTFNAAGERLAAYTHEASDPYSLSTDTVFSLLMDSAGVLWAGSLSAGLSKVNIAGARFANYWHRPENPLSLSHDMVNEFAEDGSGNLWVGTSGGGVNYFDRSTGTFRHYRHDPANSQTLSSDRVWGMHLDRYGSLWVGTWGEGLNRLETTTGNVTRIPSAGPGALPGRIVTTIVGDGDGGIWVGMADAGIVHKPAGVAEFEPYYLFDAAVEKSRPVNVSVTYLDGQRRLWVGTWSRGLCVLASAGATSRCYAYDSVDDSSINDNNIRAVNETPDGNIWVATANGIARYDDGSDAFVRYGASDGLPQGTIYGIVPESSRALWLSSNQGLYRLDLESREVRGYAFEDGLQANEFNGAAYLKASDGTYFFGGIGGITSFRPDDLVNNTVPPKIAFTGLKVFNEPIRISDQGPLSASITESDAIRIDYSDNVITIEYTGLHFVSPELNSYAHQLVGFDRDWVYRDAANRNATYTNLDPGNYEFRVRAANSDGVWSAEDAVLRISVLPPWWMTWWARGAALLAFALSIVLLFRWRLNVVREQTRQLETEVKARTAEVVRQRDTIENQARNLEELLESKNQFFARLSHEFRTPITLMLGPIEEQLENSPAESDKRALSMARRNGRRLLHLVNQLLGLARSSGEKPMERVPTNLSQLARLTADSFLPLIVRKGLELDVDAGSDVWVKGNAEGLQIVLSNLMSNAVKYTDAGGRVSLTVGASGQSAFIRFSDTGIGIAAEHLTRIFRLFERGGATGEGSGIGLTLVKEVVEAHDGTIDVSSSKGNGSMFTVCLPALVTNAENSDTGEMLGIRDMELFVEVEDLSDESPGPLEESSHRARVLIVEDNRDMRDYVRSLLEPDYQVLWADDGVAGVDLAIKELPDLIISDVMMPNADGFELLRELRGNSHSSHIPVIMLTALDDQESRLKGLTARADDYLGKPFDRRELTLRVRNLIELARIRARRMGQMLYSSDGTGSEVIAMADGLGQRDREFLKKLENAVATNYQDAGFRLEQLADALFMSPRQLQRKLRALLDTAPAAYLRDFRLKKARAELLGGRSVSDVAFATGFSSVSYFGRCFKSQFGVSPSELFSDSQKNDVADVAE